MERTAGNAVASWLTIGLAVAVTVASPGGCNKPEPSDRNDPVDVAGISDVLAAVGPDAVLPTLQAFRAEAVALENALAAWEDGGSRADARDAWVAAMEVWQQAEMMQIGPAASTLSGAVAAEDLRDEIYSWPTVNPCRVDQETAEELWGEADFFTANLANTYGLDAIEHVLYADDDTPCPPQVPPMSDGAWDDLGPKGIEANRAAFAVAMASEIVDVTDTLIAHWEGDFGADFAKAKGYEGEQDALNAVYDALFYIETGTKDGKLATPLGLKDCNAEACPEEVESIPSGESVRWIEANLTGFETLFFAGMDDLLVSEGHPEIVDDIEAGIAGAREAAEALDRPLYDAVSDGDAEARALHDAVKVLTDLVKGDLATVLSLQIPSSAAGDND